MNSSKKRYLILGGLVVLLVITGYLNFRLNTPESTTASNPEENAQQQALIENLNTNGTNQAAASETDDAQQANTQTATGNFFQDFRTERQSTREKELQYIESVISNPDTDAETLAAAQQQKLNLAEAMEQEVTMEGLIRAKGFNEAVVTVQKDSVNVVVDSATLNEAQAAQIFDIVQRTTGASSENIKIMPRE